MLNWLEIDLKAISHNIKQIKKIIGPSVSLMAVVKANAYGHGLIPTSSTALKAGASYLGVFDFEEGLRLRESDIKAPILILGFMEKEGLKEVIEKDLSLTLYDIDLAKEISEVAKKLGKKAKIHLKIDTGMHRLGILSDNIIDFLKKLKDFEGLKIEGIFSHFSEAENKEYSLWQIKRFKKALEEVRKFGLKIPFVHMANSTGALLYKEARFNLVRCGISIYGLSPYLANSKPALSFKTKIIQVKDIPSGSFVGYQRTYKTRKPTKIAILGVGYSDGYDRGLSNSGEVLIKGVRCPVIGRICMNQTIVDISQVKEVKIGDRVTLIGKDGDDKIEVGEIAKKLRTIPHEVVSRIPENVKRLYYE